MTVVSCAYDTMEGVLGDHVLGNLADLESEEIRDTMPSFCSALRRTEIDLQRNVVLRTSERCLRVRPRLKSFFQLPSAVL